MSKVTQRSFSSGETAPALYARTDVSKYATSLRTLRNAIVLRHGGTANRPGTAFVGEVKDSTNQVRLIPFIFSNSVAYVLEFGNLFMRVIKNGQHVLETAKNITAITKANPGVVTSNAHGFLDGDEVYVAGIVGMTELNARKYRVTGKTTNTFQLQTLDGTTVSTSLMTTYVSGGTVARVYKLTTPYAQADLARLKYAQSADVMTIAHNGYVPKEVRRTGDTSWSIDNISIGPNISTAVQNVNITSPGTVTYYKVTAVDLQGDETDPIATFGTPGSSLTPASGTPITVSWDLKGGSTAPFAWNVYKSTTGEFGTYGFVTYFESNGAGGTFVDKGTPADVSQTPPVNPNYFNAAGNYPAVVALAQQRRFFAASINEPEAVWASRIGSYSNYLKLTPLADDSPVKFGLAANQVTEIRNLIDLNFLFLITDQNEQKLEGDNGVITPFAVGPKEAGNNGSSYLAPLKIGSTALFVQALGSAIFDLNFDFQTESYRGNEVSVFAAHLVDDHTIVDWGFQKIPHSIAWMIRDDGVMLSLTYNREQQVFGWARHDFDGGTVENVCCIPEGREHAVYVVVKRKVNNRTVRYIERMGPRTATSLIEATFLDSFLTYDGRNTTATTMTLSGGTTWVHTETLTLTASSATFVAGDVGNQFQLFDADGNVIRFTVDAYTSSTIVTGRANKTVPASLQVATSVWARAVDEVSGLWHLEGKNVSILGDGYVVASPYNDSYTTVTVTAGKITLDKCYAVIHVGLPITTDIQTLDIDTPQGESMVNKKILVNSVTIQVQKTAGVWVGSFEPTGDDPLENLNELKVVDNDMPDARLTLDSGKKTIATSGNWDSNGRVFIRQIDPLPMSILSISPDGLIPLPR